MANRSLEFELTDMQRAYFGLDPIDKKWEPVELKKNVWLFFEGNVLRKVIQLRQRSDYSETDYVLKTNKRKVLLPKTAKGKEKPLTLSGIEQHAAIHFSLSVRFDRRPEFKSNVYEASVVNRHAVSSRTIPTPCDPGMKTFAEFSAWLTDFIAASPLNYVADITRLKEENAVQVRYRCGDLFAFPISRTSYGVGKILFPVKEILKKHPLPEGHYFTTVMAVPLLVRLYGKEFSCESTLTLSLPDTPPDDYPLLPAYFMQDTPVLRGTYPIIGHQWVVEGDLDFPLSYDMNSGLLCWGMAMVVTPVPLETYIDPHTQGIRLLENGVAGGASVSVLKKFLEGESLYYEYEIAHPNNRKLRDEIFNSMGISPAVSYDEFCLLTRSISRTDVIRLLDGRGQ